MLLPQSDSKRQGEMARQLRASVQNVIWITVGMDYVYVDNSNLYIEGRRVSAVRNGLARSIVEAMNEGILD